MLENISRETEVMSVRQSFGTASLVAMALLLLSSCSSSVKVGPQAIAGLTPDGTIDMQEVQVAYLASGGGGHGTLFYQGNAYPFTIGGLGVGGIGASTISASGEVYKLRDVSEFSGAWIQGTGSLAITTKSNGELWLENRNGVVMRLSAAQAGLTFSEGRYELYIHLSQ